MTRTCDTSVPTFSTFPCCQERSTYSMPENSQRNYIVADQHLRRSLYSDLKTALYSYEGWSLTINRRHRFYHGTELSECAPRVLTLRVNSPHIFQWVQASTTLQCPRLLLYQLRQELNLYNTDFESAALPIRLLSKIYCCGHLEEASRDGSVDFGLQNTKTPSCKSPDSRYFRTTIHYQTDAHITGVS